jgi:LysM repeat protein
MVSQRVENDSPTKKKTQQQRGEDVRRQVDLADPSVSRLSTEVSSSRMRAISPRDLPKVNVDASRDRSERAAKDDRPRKRENAVCRDDDDDDKDRERDRERKRVERRREDERRKDEDDPVRRAIQKLATAIADAQKSFDRGRKKDGDRKDGETKRCEGRSRDAEAAAADRSVGARDERGGTDKTSKKGSKEDARRGDNGRADNGRNDGSPDGNRDCKRDQDRNGKRDAGRNGNRDADRNGHRDGNCDRDGDRDGNRDRGRNGNRDGDRNGNRDDDRNGNRDGDRNGNRDGDRNGNRNGNRDGDRNGNRDDDRNGNRDRDRGPRDDNNSPRSEDNRPGDSPIPGRDDNGHGQGHIPNLPDVGPLPNHRNDSDSCPVPNGLPGHDLSGSEDHRPTDGSDAHRPRGGDTFLPLPDFGDGTETSSATHVFADADSPSRLPAFSAEMLSVLEMPPVTEIPSLFPELPYGRRESDRLALTTAEMLAQQDPVASLLAPIMDAPNVVPATHETVAQPIAESTVVTAMLTKEPALVSDGDASLAPTATLQTFQPAPALFAPSTLAMDSAPPTLETLPLPGAPEEPTKTREEPEFVPWLGAPTMLPSSESSDATPAQTQPEYVSATPSVLQNAIAQGIAADPNAPATTTSSQLPTNTPTPTSTTGGAAPNGLPADPIDPSKVLPTIQIGNPTERFDDLLVSVNTMIGDAARRTSVGLNSVLENSNDRVTHKVKDGQTLEEIAVAHYGDARYAELIYRMNMKEIPAKFLGATKLRLHLVENMNLRLPTRQEFDNFLQAGMLGRRKNFEYEERRRRQV